MQDILAAEAAKWRRIEDTARRVFEAYGYGEIRLPIVERTELFTQSIGEVTDIVQKQMYTFEDRGGESLTLRPEATAGLLRAYIEHGLHVEPKPVRLYTLGPMFRYERPQAGRYRQFHQLNVEALGEDRPSLDAEVIAMLMEFFRQLQLSGPLELQINSLGHESEECRPRYRKELQRYLRDNAVRLCQECRDRIERNPLRVLDCKRSECQPVLRAAPSLVEYLCAACAEHFAKTREYLEAMAIAYVVNPRLVRGLDYYVRTTFELTTTELGAQNAVAGGGRYDGLIKLLGGPPDPGIGFAVGIERVVKLLPGMESDTSEARKPFVALIPLGDEALKQLSPIAREIRATGIRVELGDGGRKLRSELERAARIGAQWTVIVGDTERAQQQAILRNMKTRHQESIDLKDVAEKILGLRGAR